MIILTGDIFSTVCKQIIHRIYNNELELELCGKDGSNCGGVSHVAVRALYKTATGAIIWVSYGN